MNGAATRRVLDQAAEARAREMRAAVMREIPEARPWISDLVKHGLIDGWRNVAYVGPHRDTGGVTADVFLANSKGTKGHHGTPPANV